MNILTEGAFRVCGGVPYLRQQFQREHKACIRSAVQSPGARRMFRSSSRAASANSFKGYDLRAVF